MYQFVCDHCRTVIEPSEEKMWGLISTDKMLQPNGNRHFHQLCVKPFLLANVITEETEVGSRITLELRPVY